MASIFCTQCGHANDPGARYCVSCGLALARPGPAVAADQPASRQVRQSATSAFTAADAQAARTGPGEHGAGEHGVDSAGGDADAALGLPAGAALLVLKRGPGAGSRFLLDAAVTTTGRHPDADIFLDDVTVSRRHAEFGRHREEFTVTDVGSLNGTYVNRGRVETIVLAGGDEIQIGQFRMVFLTA